MSTLFNHQDTPLPLEYFERKYGVSRTTLWRYRRAGLPTLSVGAKSFVRESDFVVFLERMNGQSIASTAVNPESEAN